jgi:transposase
MLTLALPTRVYLCLAPTDMRKSFDSLAAVVSEQLRHDPFSGSLFVFRSKRRDRIKLLYWDTDGFMIWMKRLERGIYEFPLAQADCDSSSLSVSSTDLALILSGIDLNSAKRRPRYHRPPPNPA